ncbi:MAG: NADH-quinone oxidoreductase subunit C [Rickettsiales bacterium]
MKETLAELGDYLEMMLAESLVSQNIYMDELTVYVGRDALVRVMSQLHDDAHCMFKQLMDITAVDYPAKKERFEVVYHLLSIKHNQRIRVKVTTDEVTPVPSIVSIYPTAGWFEREAWDMYGVFFSGNPDLRRILTDYGFDGHPLRKDFPLTGYVELRYDPEQQRVVYEPVKLPQAYRNFDSLSPWEGGFYALPGDEKAS